ncbi:MAG: conjugal transfer protein TraG [Parageobacillus thermoglucosidasius]|nr:MAG: conjugal transfer protein TraG [Parageobacillus thermoglucosidasius]
MKVKGSVITSKIPMVSMYLLGLVSLFLSLKSFFNYLFLISSHFLDSIPMFVLFGNPTKPSLLFFIMTTVFLIGSWLISTKYKKFQSPRWRILWFYNMFFGIFFHYLVLITAPIINRLIPYLAVFASRMETENIWQAIAIGDIDMLFTFILFLPTTVSLLVLLWLVGQYQSYSEDIKEAFFEFEFKNSLLQKWFGIEDIEKHWPDIVLGPETKTRELVIQPGRDRTLNNIIIGSIGTGKTSTLILQMINQDLHWMTRFINDFSKISKRKDYHTEKVKGMYLNGISIIEPSNDLCQKALQLVKAHGIPEESVFYIDPTNPNTPSINPMQGPVEKVAEAFAKVMEGLAEGRQSNFFFQQSERNHLKHYIYLLKLHDPDQEVTFDMLLRMYDNPQYVRKMHLKLKETIPKNIEEFEDRDERNHWAIVKQVDEWFDMHLLPRVDKNGVPRKVTHGEFRGEDEYYDAEAEYVRGLRNVLNDIGANPLIRRVLFGKTNFDFDRHLEAGGVLLVNTAKGELDALSNVLGKLVLLSLQNAVFRRKPMDSTFHHIIVDEFPDYIYRSFKEFPAQSRKYKTIITVAAQTLAQLADKYGESYMQSVIASFRHKMVFGDVTNYDAELFSKIFGTKEEFEENISEQEVSPLQENPMLRKGKSYQKKEVPILSPSDIIYQKPFQCAVKIVFNNKPLPVKQIDANFVPEEEREKALITVDPSVADVWLEYRRKVKTKSLLVREIIDEEEAEFVSSEGMKDGLMNGFVQPLEKEANKDTVANPISGEKEKAWPENEFPVFEIEQPSGYRFEESEQDERQLNGSALGKPVLLSAKPNVQVAGHSDTKDVEVFSFDEIFSNATTKKVRIQANKPVQSELGEEQYGLINELKKEIESLSDESKDKEKEVVIEELFRLYDEE